MRVDPLKLVEGQGQLPEFRRPPEQPPVQSLESVVAQYQRVQVHRPSHQVVHFDLADLVVPDVKMRQLSASSESLAREISDDVAGDAERPEGLAEGAEYFRGEIRDVVVGEVEVAQVAESGEGVRNVVQPVPLEINKFENL